MTFQQAIDHEMDLLRYHIMMEEEHALFHDGLPKLAPFIPCPISLGNDPCDDWSRDEEDYDW
jgi:hypothetical protein